MDYRSLSSDFTSGITSVSAPTYSATAVSFFTSVSFLYSLLFTVTIVAAGVMYARGGLWRMEASESSIRKSNEEFKRVTWGLLGVLTLFVLISTFNRDLLRGDIGLDAFRLGKVSSLPQTNTSSNSSSRTCESVDSVKNSFSSPGGVCGGASCTALTGCTYSEFLPIIKREASRLGVDPKMIVITMCKESKGKKDAQNKNPNGSYDCGLMQVNQSEPCGATSLSVEANIAKGAETLKAKIQSSSRVYPGVPVEANVFASYNCCANGTVPSAQSADCTKEGGWPSSGVPKWACPINPGEGQFNMCAVKSYACDLSACFRNSSLEGL